MLTWSKKNQVALTFAALLFAGSTGSAALPVNAAAKETKLPCEELFHDVQGTLIIKNLKKDRVYVCNPERSRQRFTPESSFKVPNALIGLEAGAVQDEYDVKRWDGIVRPFETWNRDHTLASAMRASAIWYYQAMARDIGAERMKDYVERIHYGNMDISGGIDTFWLDSSLKISAEEQVGFMEDLVEETLPFQEQTMKTVKRIMIDNDQDKYTVHGKTGTRLSDMGLGWYVGYVERGKTDWVFAANVDSSGTTAKTVTLEALKRLGIM
ncbi:class D beta-lactamase [Bacillus sp. 3255]|uniref:class D beta-lactamase n=1 Tax=Bacillus sp. 3255 TaxID=2817904 RepID=UPI002855A582|nr:class D beta-lactamase [Bacillus sp. 3255]MDR6881389.1 beta-lactamase class D [Bacillus sp. 3255]